MWKGRCLNYRSKYNPRHIYIYIVVLHLSALDVIKGATYVGRATLMSLTVPHMWTGDFANTKVLFGVSSAHKKLSLLNQSKVSP